VTLRRRASSSSTRRIVLAGRRPGAPPAAGSRRPRRRRARQHEHDRGALPDLALDVDVPAVAGDDAVHDRQAEAGAAADVLGREERLEHVLQRGLVHAHAGVLDADLHARAERVVGVAVAGVHAQGQHAAPRHGVAGVDAEVEQRLLQLRRLAADVQLRLDVELELDVADQRARDEPAEVLDERADVDRGVADAGAAGDAEELVRHLGRAGGRVDRVAQHVELDVGRALAGLHVALQLRQVAEHDREQVVELVGDAAGEATDGLHLLALEQALLDGVAVGELKDGVVADLDGVAVVQLRGGDAAAVHPGAVLAAEVLEADLIGRGDEDAGVSPRDAVVVDVDRGVVRAAEDHLAGDRVHRARVRPVQRDQHRPTADPLVGLHVQRGVGGAYLFVLRVHGPSVLSLTLQPRRRCESHHRTSPLRSKLPRPVGHRRQLGADPGTR
jgi:hypothetical protein